jgi:hypothetical protein
MRLHIIYTESEIVLSKKDYASRQEVQRDFPDYKAFLGPWLDAAVIDYLDAEYFDIFPSAHAQVSATRDSELTTSVVRFRK